MPKLLPKDRLGFEIGKAVGLETAATILRALADHDGRVVGTKVLKGMAQGWEELAEELRDEAERKHEEANR